MSDNPYPNASNTMNYELHTAWDEGYAEGFAAGRAALPDPPEAFLCPDCGHIGDAVSRIDRACVNHPPGERRPMVRLRSRADAERLAAALPDPPTARDIAQAFKDGDHQRGIVLASEAKAAASPDERLREAGERLAQAVARVCGEGHPALGMWRVALAAADREKPGQKITHGRHCTCTPCAVEDWTNPAFTPCGMHGRDCPQEYQPLGPAGSFAPPVPDDQKEKP